MATMGSTTNSLVISNRSSLLTRPPAASDRFVLYSEVFDYVINCYLIHMVAAVGLVGNTFNIVVLARHGLNDSTNVMLLSMSVMDMLLVLTSPIRRCSCIVSRFDPGLALTIAAFDRVYLAVANRVAGILSATHIVLISLERVVAVYQPFKVGLIFSPPRTKRYILVIYVFWLSLALPFFFLFQFSWVFDEKLQQYVGAANFSPFYIDNFVILNLVNTMLLNNIRGSLYIVTVLVCSALIGVQLHRAGVRRARISSSKGGVDMKAVRMLFVVSLVYLSLGVPVYLMYTYFYYNMDAINDGTKLSVLYTILNGYITDFLYTLNSSLNFIIYVTMSSKFRITCKELLGIKES